MPVTKLEALYADNPEQLELQPLLESVLGLLLFVKNIWWNAFISFSGSFIALIFIYLCINLWYDPGSARLVLFSGLIAWLPVGILLTANLIIRDLRADLKIMIQGTADLAQKVMSEVENLRRSGKLPSFPHTAHIISFAMFTVLIPAIRNAARKKAPITGWLMFFLVLRTGRILFSSFLTNLQEQPMETNSSSSLAGPGGVTDNESNVIHQKSVKIEHAATLTARRVDKILRMIDFPFRWGLKLALLFLLTFWVLFAF